MIDSWHQAWTLLSATVDDEPYMAEEAAKDDAALVRLRQGEGVPLDQLDSEPGADR